MHRVLHYIGSLNHGGAQSVIMNLYRQIDRSKWQFDFISHSETEIDLRDEIESLGGRCYFIRPLKGLNFLSFQKSWADFFHEHGEYEIIHSHMRSTASLVVPQAKRAGLCTIVHSHSTSNGTGASAIVKNFLQYPVRFEADYMISCSHEAGRWLFGSKACQGNRYFYLPNAIDLDTYRFDAPRRERYRKELNLDGFMVYGHVGRLNAAKNHRFLIEVFSLIHCHDKNTRLLLVGDGELREEISGLIRDAGLSDCVLMLGDRNDVPSLLQAMDVFLFPSLWEGLPVTVVEALASGLPCYVSDAITHDIDISDRVVRLSVEDAKVWASKVREIGEPRCIDAIEDVRRGGFDITSSARTLTSVYEDALCIARMRKTRRRFFGEMRK